MAKIGMRYPVYRTMNITTDDNGEETVSYGQKAVMGKAISASVSVQTSESKLYADDGLAESIKEFIEGTLTITTDDLEDSVEAALLGAKTALGTGGGGEIVNNRDDTAPWVEVGFVAVRMKNGKKQFRGVLYTKVQFAIPNEDNTTKGETITFGTPTLTGTLTADKDGNWRKKSGWMDTASGALEWLDGKMA